MISLAIPTIGNKPQKYLKDCIESAANTPSQIYSEIIIADNSQNGSSDFISQFEQIDSRIKYYRIEDPLNMVENWNFLLQKSRNNWIQYLHDDDLLMPIDKEKKKFLSELPEVGFISFDYFKLTENSEKLKRRDSGMNGILKDAPKFVSTIINKKFLKEIDGWEANLGYALDLAVFCKLHALYDSKHISVPLGKMRIHEMNASKVSDRIETYAQSIDQLIVYVWPYLNTEYEMKLFLHHISKFTFPHQTIVSRILNKIGRLLGYKSWIIKQKDK